MAAGAWGPRAFTASCLLLCCLLQWPQVGQGLRIGLLGFLFVSGPVLKAPVLGPFGTPKGCSVRCTAAMFILWRSYGRDTKADVGKHAFFAILVSQIAPKRPFALPYDKHPP